MSGNLFIRLLTLVDDFGRTDGRTSVIFGQCFAVWNELHPGTAVKLQQVAGMLQQLAGVELIDIYEVDGKRVLQIAQWQERIREGCKPKWEKKPELAASCSDLLPSSPSSPPSPTPVHPRHLPARVAPQLERVKGFFRKRPETQLDSSERRAWDSAKEVVLGTSEDEWTLLEWVYAAIDGDAARFRRKDMATLLNNWNGEIARAANWKRAGSNGSKPRTKIDEEYDAAQARIAAKKNRSSNDQPRAERGRNCGTVRDA